MDFAPIVSALEKYHCADLFALHASTTILGSDARRKYFIFYQYNHHVIMINEFFLANYNQVWQRERIILARSRGRDAIR